VKTQPNARTGSRFPVLPLAWAIALALGSAAAPARADQPLPPAAWEQAVKLVRGGVSVAEISTYNAALRSFQLLDAQFAQEAPKEPPPGNLHPPAAKTAAGPKDMVTTWDHAYFPFQLNFEDLVGPQVTRTWQRDPAMGRRTGGFWSVFASDPVFTVVSRGADSVTMVWPDPAVDESDVFIERTWTLVGDYQLEGRIRLVNLGPTDVTGRIRLLVTAWENPFSASGGTCGGAMFAAPPDIREAVCTVGGDLQKKDRKALLEEPGFEVPGPVQYAGINTRYFLAAALPQGGAPTQCIAGADPSGLMTVALQWGDDEGRPFSLRSGVESCLPDYVSPAGRFSGRMSCAEAIRLLGLRGDEDMRAIDAVAVGDLGDAGLRAKSALMGRRARDFRYTAFVGPKDFDALKAAGPGLDDTIDFWILGILAKPMLWLMRLSYSIIPSWGIAIIFLTLIVKLLTLYWTQKSMISMKRMADLKPKMDALKEKFKDDRAKMNQAMMDLYKREKVNPMGGCLPMLLQMPIWIALYRTIYGAVDLYQAPLFLWIKDLSVHDPFFVMPVMLGVLMFVQQKMTPTAGDPMQAKMMLWMMPIMFTSFMLFLPSGLVFYILVNTVLGIAHQQVVNRGLIGKLVGKPSKAG
jgi:YidC/Oxa1 family membrane protein insertase